MDVRWVSWLTTERVDAAQAFMRMDSVDAILDNPHKYATAAHAVTGEVGGYADDGHGRAGKALCGVAVPSDEPGAIYMWLTPAEQRKRCKRCEKKTTSPIETECRHRPAPSCHNVTHRKCPRCGKCLSTATPPDNHVNPKE